MHVCFLMDKNIVVVLLQAVLRQPSEPLTLAAQCRT
jgi:hypothetical protein